MLPPFLRRLTLRNYRSVAACRLDFGPATFLVGPNGSGKSNILDSLAFVSDALDTTLESALKRRGGLQEVRRRSSGLGRPNNMAIRLDVTLPDGREGHYAFSVAAKGKGGWEVQQEEAELAGSKAFPPVNFRVFQGDVQSTSEELRASQAPDRLYLPRVSGVPALEGLYEALLDMAIFKLDPERIGSFQTPLPGRALTPTGDNAASVLAELPAKAKRDLIATLARIVPGLKDLKSAPIAELERLEMVHAGADLNKPWTFPGSSMSDGTLRALGILLVLAQIQKKNEGPSLIGLEEPETAIHPAALRVLLGEMLTASSKRQVIVTSHSPELLDSQDIMDDQIVSVEMRDGQTVAGPVDAVGRQMIRDRLFTAGELLRQNQLRPGTPPFGEAEAKDSKSFFSIG